MQQKDSTKKIIKSDSHTYRYKDSTDHKDKDSFELPKSHGLPAGSRHHDPVKPVRTKSPSSLKADRKKEFEVYRQ